MDLKDLTATQEDFSFYYSEWFLSRRQWKMRGIKFISLSNGRIDTDWAADIIIEDAKAHRKAVDDCELFRASMTKRPSRKAKATLERLEFAAKNHMPSRETSILLLYSQVQTLYKLLKGFRTLTHYEMIYDYLTLKVLSIHHSILDSKGNPKKAFLQNPISHLENCCKTYVNQLMYDIYRSTIDNQNGKVVQGIRAPERNGRERINTVTLPSDELIGCMDVARVHDVTLEAVLFSEGPCGFTDSSEWYD